MSGGEREVGRDFGHAISSAFERHGDAILTQSNLIDTALHENTHKVNRIVGFAGIRHSLMDVIGVCIEDKSERENVATSILYSAEKWNVVSEDLEDADISNDLRDFLLNLHLKYEAEIETSRMKASHGEQFWNRLSREFVRRETGLVGINHRLELYSNEEIRFSNSPNSAIVMARILVDQTEELVDEFDEEAAEAIEQGSVNSLVESLESFKKKMSLREESGQTTFEDHSAPGE